MTTLIVIDQPPYGSWTGREAMDMLFSLAAFDQPAALLFIGAGVNWLRRSQNASGIGQKTVEKNLSAAPLFGVDRIYAEQAACDRFLPDAGQRVNGVELAPSVKQLLDQHDHVFFAG
ncbi:DsrE family protein [Marinobacter halophilus]|uniref:Sulfur reduction protein DsrE n=1 Tax=Marinobacter halophilus TaxID=1323740 RepID=A0A2T1K9Y9_9GAMM|nr:DsrE family protein [Marinobacter halophilus]PSF06362.1 sulfur reduction protein DsrE [Marinobacter halophilus]GGC71916.1 protein TusC [Marinobacter halophilus]